MATYWENSCSSGLRYVSWYKYLIVSLFFSHLGFWSGNLFLIAPFPDLCLLVPFHRIFILFTISYDIRLVRCFLTSTRYQYFKIRDFFSQCQFEFSFAITIIIIETLFCCCIIHSAAFLLLML